MSQAANSSSPSNIAYHPVPTSSSASSKTETRVLEIAAEHSKVAEEDRLNVERREGDTTEKERKTEKTRRVHHL